MSINLHVRAYEVFEHPVLGKKEFDYKFDLYQTPTDITYQCLKNKDPLKVYTEWVLKNSQPVVENIYEQTDFFYEKPPIGTKTVNYGEIHIKELNQWLKNHKNWKIEWFML